MKFGPPLLVCRIWKTTVRLTMVYVRNGNMFVEIADARTIERMRREKPQEEYRIIITTFQNNYCSMSWHSKDRVIGFGGFL